MKSYSQPPGFLADYCDGSCYKSHPLYREDMNAPQIIAYFDEVEVCNPFGSRACVLKLGTYA